MKTRMRITLSAAILCCTGSMFAQMSSGAMPSGDTSAKDKMFLMKASQGGMAEIQASKMALMKSKNDDVKMYAQKMVDDHTKLMADMKPFCDQMGVKPPMKLKKTDQIEAQRLKAMKGDKFDKEYVNAMVADHHKDLGEFKNEADTTSNSDLKATVTSATGVIKEHTDMIDSMAQKMGIATPPQPSM